VLGNTMFPVYSCSSSFIDDVAKRHLYVRLHLVDSSSAITSTARQDLETTNGKTVSTERSLDTERLRRYVWPSDASPSWLLQQTCQCSDNGSINTISRRDGRAERNAALFAVCMDPTAQSLTARLQRRRLR